MLHQPGLSCTRAGTVLIHHLSLFRSISCSSAPLNVLFLLTSQARADLSPFQKNPGYFQAFEQWLLLHVKQTKNRNPAMCSRPALRKGQQLEGLGQELPLGNRMKTQPGLMFKTQKTQMQTENPVIILLTLAIFHPNI